MQQYARKRQNQQQNIPKIIPAIHLPAVAPSH